MYQFSDVRVGEYSGEKGVLFAAQICQVESRWKLVRPIVLNAAIVARGGKAASIMDAEVNRAVFERKEDLSMQCFAGGGKST